MCYRDSYSTLYIKANSQINIKHLHMESYALDHKSYQSRKSHIY